MSSKAGSSVQQYVKEFQGTTRYNKASGEYLISVITVVLNNKDEVEATLKSVLGQKEECMEYVVIDGGSSDGTVAIIERHLEGIDVFVSEPDKGLYDAMNKGILLANGHWLIFINSGDLLEALEDTLWNILRNEKELAVVFGRCKVERGGRVEYNWGHKLVSCESIILKPPFFHQAIFYNRKYIDRYVLKFRIIADRVMTYGLCVACGIERFKFVNSVIATFRHGGVSSINQKTVLNEELMFMRDNGLYEKYKWRLFVKRMRVHLVTVAKLFPGWSRISVLRWKLSSRINGDL